MVASFSPHRDAGGTLHFPSPSGIHHSHTNSAISQLRRSLSRSPSKGADFRLLSPSKLNPSSSSRKKGFTSSPLSPSKYYPQGNIFLVPHNSTASPVAIPFPPSAKIHRPTMRRSGALQSSRTRSAPSPSKRVLTESRDNGNSGPNRMCPADTIEPKLNVEDSPHLKPTQLEPFCFAASMEVSSEKTESKHIPSHRIEKRRSGNFGSFASTSSPLKRGESGVNLGPPGSGSPSPKRRSTQNTSFESEFDLFDPRGSTPGRSTIFGEPEGRGSNPFATIPKRSTSLRKSTLQQRQIDRPLFPRTKSNESQGGSTPSRAAATQNGQRMSLDSDIFPPTNFDQASFYNAPTPLFPSRASFPSHQPPVHPLSRAITQSSSNSSFADDSPTHRPPSPIVKAPKPILNFSKSLPAGSTRPVEANQRQESFNDGDSPFATPENYKFVKPLPAAFMSTGLISKKNRNPDMHNSSVFKSNMPDTPCKRMSHIFTTNSPLPRNTGLKKASDKPYNGSPWASFDSGKGSVTRGSGIFGSSRIGQTRSRRGSFASVDGENSYQSPSAAFDTHYNGDSDLPPTPTKQGLPREKSTISDFRSRLLNNSQNHSFDSSASASVASSSPVHNRFFDRETPQTPREHIQPPDPSGLSISARSDRGYGFMDSHPSGLPATPTGPRDSFASLGKRASLSLGYSAPDVDPSLTARFDKVELVGSGEFSLVYSVTERRPSTTPSMTPIFSLNGQNPSSFVGADKVWAVKKSKQPYAGVNDRQRRHNEVVVLKELGNSDHIINFVDSWEDYNYLYIQTEFCEEGSLDVFLSQVGLKARLDDFRIWKILLELSHGLKHIHDSGFIHLDLKPANILITFEGVLKIADFGMAARWPATDGIDGEGDREYIGPEVLMGRYDKPADVFALGLIMFETAGNVELPDNGVSWQKLRNGDMSDVPSLTWSCESNNIVRDASGNPLSECRSFEELCTSEEPSYDNDISWDLRDDDSNGSRLTQRKLAAAARSGELAEPPAFMVDANHEQALDKLVRWMISPDPADRPKTDDVLTAFGVQWAERRRRAGATIFEGNWGPADEVLVEDAEMIDV